MSFLKTGLATLQESNYNVFVAITELNLVNLKENIGLYLALSYWGSFLLLLFICGLVDYSKLRHSFYEKIRANLIKQKSQVEVEKQPEARKEKKAEHRYYQPKFKRDQPLRRVKQFESALKLNESVSNTQLTLPPQEDPFSQGIESDEKKPTKDKTVSRIQEIKMKMKAVIEERSCCCCTFSTLLRNELAQNNQLYNLITKTSPLNRRSLRLVLCYVALLLELALCALFYNLGPSSSGPLFWDKIISNFWVSLYSVLFSLVPLLFLGLCLSVSRSQVRALRVTQEIEQLKSAYRRIKPKLKCKSILAAVWFFLFSNFLLLYLICFCHLANPETAQDWIRSAFLSILIDQIAFELAPAFLVGFLGTIQGCCKKSACPLNSIICIEVYRVYKNLIEG